MTGRSDSESNNINEYIMKLGWEFRAKPTPEAIEKSTFKAAGLNANDFWHYYLRTPHGFNMGIHVMLDTYNGGGPANYGITGVRPAMYIYKSYLTGTTGAGTELSPYVVSDYSQYFKDADDTQVVQLEEISHDTDVKEEIQIIKEAKAVSTSSQVIVNGTGTPFDAYNIGDNNYFKLRDIALVVNGTSKQFQITWDRTKNAINLISNTPYTVVGGEMALGTGFTKTAVLTTSKIYKDGVEVKLTAYNIGGYNYFKLRDIAQAFNIGVGWDGGTNTITIDTTKGYVVPE